VAKIGHAVPEICTRTDRQTYEINVTNRGTDTLITIHRHAYKGRDGVKMIVIYASK